jgi:hypothetical protein
MLTRLDWGNSPGLNNFSRLWLFGRENDDDPAPAENGGAPQTLDGLDHFLTETLWCLDSPLND